MPGLPQRPVLLPGHHVYHELTDLARTLERVENHSVAVREWKGEVVFLRRIVPGPASQSYGIQVAQLAGVPRDVVERAKQILANLERGELDEAGRPRLADAGGTATDQLGLFTERDHALVEALRAVDIDRLTPLDALTRLAELVDQARRSSS